MEHNAPEVETTGALHGVIACGCGGMGYVIPPKHDEVPEPYDERESQP